jgi:hypothetical protein
VEVIRLFNRGFELSSYFNLYLYGKRYANTARCVGSKEIHNNNGKNLGSRVGSGQTKNGKG